VAVLQHWIKCGTEIDVMTLHQGLSKSETGLFSKSQ
jgi:hypothetical protein